MVILVPSQLSQSHKERIDNWTYAFTENSLVTRYFYQPWWNFCAKLPPSWMSPNQLTLIGCLWMYAYAIIEAYHNPSMARPEWRSLPLAASRA